MSLNPQDRGSVQPTPGGPLDPGAWQYPKSKEVNGETERIGRALTTVNEHDFNTHTAPTPPEAD